MCDCVYRAFLRSQHFFLDICPQFTKTNFQIDVEVTCKFEKDILHGDKTNEIRLTMLSGYGKKV